MRTGGLAPIADSVTFLIDVVRGPTYHPGSPDGVAVWNGSSARFSLKEDGKESETWLTFIKRDVRLEVIGENTSPFHEVRAYFKGKYSRLRELTDEDRKGIVSPEQI